MFNSYFKAAFRTLQRYKFHSLQNVVGLSLALTISIIGVVYIYNELNYEKSFKNAERIFRINTDLKIGDQVKETAQSADPIAPLWQKQSSEIEMFARIFPIGSLKIKKNTDYIRGERAAYVDTSLFPLFGISFVHKIVATPLSEPNTIVITTSTAQKYFGTKDAAGLMLEVDDVSNSIKGIKNCKVVAVIEDFPKNSHLQFDILFPMKNLEYSWNRNFAGTNFNTYVLLKPGSDYSLLNKKFEQVTQKDIYPVVTRQLGLKAMEWQEFVSIGNKLQLQLFPLLDIHLSSNRSGELTPNGNKEAVQVLSILIVFMIFMASVNFINLSTALAMRRAKAIGIHKVIGSTRKNLILKLLLESLILVLGSAVIAFILAVLSIPFANDILEVTLKISDFFQPSILLALVILIAANALLSGLYPAFYLSGINIISALQGSNNVKVGGGFLRKSLIFLQFSVAIFLIISTITIYRQLNFLKRVDIGYSKEQTLVIDNFWTLKDKTASFKNEIKAIPGVRTISLTGSIPVNSSGLQGYFSTDATKTSQGGVPMRNWFVDEEFIKALDIQLISGRNFGSSNNMRTAIINEQAQHALGLKDAINTKLYTDDTSGITVIGVLKDFNYESLRQSIEPILLTFSPGPSAEYAVIKFDANVKLEDKVEKVKEIWKGLTSDEPISYYFLDDAFDKAFRTDQTLAKATFIVSFLAISICCIGLFGLITFVASMKKKEIAVRKVLGASVISIVKLLSKDFIQLGILAFFLAAPLAWWILNNWLQDFVYRIDVAWWMMLFGVSIVLTIAFLSVAYQAIKAAMVKPVGDLKAD